MFPCEVGWLEKIMNTSSIIHECDFFRMRGFDDARALGRTRMFFTSLPQQRRVNRLTFLKENVNNCRLRKRKKTWFSPSGTSVLLDVPSPDGRIQTTGSFNSLSYPSQDPATDLFFEFQVDAV